MQLLNRFRRMKKLWNVTPEQEALLLAMNTPEEPKLTVFVPTPEQNAEVLLPLSPDEELAWHREQEGWGDFIRRNLGAPPRQQ